MSAGVNTCATLAYVQRAADGLWADAARNKDFIGSVQTLTAIRENQSVMIEELTNPMKDKTVTIYWPTECDTTTAACSNDCATAGSLPGTSCQDYTLDICREVEFAVTEKTYRTIAPTFEEAVAVSLLRKMKVLDEYITVQAVNKLEAGKGVNAYTGGKGTVSGFTTTVNPAYWNASLFPYLKLVADYNKFSAPYLISGANLYEAKLNAMANAGNSDGKGAATLFGMFPIYNDIFNIDSTLADQVTFLVNKNALAFHSKTYYNWNAGDSQAEKWGGSGSSTGYRYQIESKNLPGVFYDVIYKISCASDVITHNWKIQFHGGIFRNPVGCNINDTNILKFVC